MRFLPFLARRGGAASAFDRLAASQHVPGRRRQPDGRGPLTDWQGLAAANRVNHSPDPSAQDTAFVAGSNEDQPVLWDLTTEPGGVNPAKSNILDAWEVSDPLGGDVFVYLAFARESAQLFARAGTTYLTFELNHDARLWNNGRADIPCRTTGDVLVYLPGDRERRLGDPAALGHEYVG